MSDVTDLAEITARVLAKFHQQPGEEPSEDTKDRAAREAERVQEQQWAVWDACGVPSRLQGADLSGENVRPTAALEAVRQYLLDEFDEGSAYIHGRALVLAGPTGVGKSWAAAAALRHAIRQRMANFSRPFVVFRYFPAVVGQLLDPAQRQDTLVLMKDTRFVVLDDLGVEYVKDGGLMEAFLDEIIWHREAESRPTIITTNLTADGMRDRLSARIVDRLRGWATIHALPGDSQRG